MKRSLPCCDCGEKLVYKGRGLPPRRCRDCKLKLAAAKQAAYYEEHKAEIAAKQAAYREEHKAEIAAKKAGREGRLCAECGEMLRHPSETGLCGFCEAEAQEAA